MHLLKRLCFPITDDHIHIDLVNGRGIEAAKDFKRAGGTHLFLVSKPSSSYGITPRSGEAFEEVFQTTLKIAQLIRGIGLTVFPLLGVHPAEISRLCDSMPPWDAADIMKDALDCAATHVLEGVAVGIKSGRPHYDVSEGIRTASNDVLLHALTLGAECGCAVQVHAESGPCTDIVAMAEAVNMPISQVVKHFAIPETPLVPSLIARHDAIPKLCKSRRRFTMESDYMDENSRPGAVIGPKSVPRFTYKLFENGLITEEDVYRIHVTTPQTVYGIEIMLP